MFWQRSLGRLMASAVLVVLAGCATAPEPSDPDAVAEYEQANDPMEPFNRGVFTFNEAEIGRAHV